MRIYFLKNHSLETLEPTVPHCNSVLELKSSCVLQLATNPNRVLHSFKGLPWPLSEFDFGTWR